VVAANLGGGPRTVRLSGAGRVLLSTHPDRDGRSVGRDVELRADEGIVVATD
jgi:uncharacterized protein (AIM24 family)